ncbi:MAG: FMN-binding negative transcriptional regulator [Alphaproteobacteria bacterium]|nr:FMN-binding negative transcriptional regulator [Alphaproteobacteria bacterium]
MYRPAFFREDHLDILHEWIRSHPLGTLISGGRHELMASLVPFSLVTKGDSPGVLRAHLARPNPQLETLREGADVLVVFQGPQAYVTPSWYVSKKEHGQVVPTWNYVVVEARGKPMVIEDASWLLSHLNALTNEQEKSRSEPWKVGDAPADFIASQLTMIVGVEIRIERLEGKWKVSQNRSEADRQGVVKGLRAEGAETMAALVEAGGAVDPDQNSAHENPEGTNPCPGP